MTGLEPGVIAAIVGAGTAVYSATRKVPSSKGKKGPDLNAAAASKAASDRRRRAALASQGHSGSVLTGPSGVQGGGGGSKVLGG